MNTKVYWLHHFDSAADLGIMARPRGGEWLNDEINSLKRRKIDFLVSLLESDETQELGLKDESELCLKNKIEFINFPIIDRGIPKSKEKTKLLIDLLMTQLNTGKNVVIHCRMGIGRSSIIAAAVLLKMGQKADDIIKHISKVRGLNIPDTNEQLEWLKKQEFN